MDSVRRSAVRRQNVDHDAPWNEKDIVLARQAPLDKTETIGERRQRQFEHHDRALRSAHIGQERVEALRELVGRRTAEKICPSRPIACPRS